MRIAPLVLLLIAGVLASPSLQAQQQPPSRAHIVSAAKEVIQKAHYCGLITLDGSGAPQAREVDPFEPGDDMVVWLGTNAVTRKVGQITKDPRVALFCATPEGSGYLTLLGKAEIVRTPEAKAAHWKPAWKGFYQDENRGEDYVLVRIQPTSLEIVSMPHGLMNDPKTWKPVTLEF